MSQPESGRVAIILGVFVLILLGLAAYVVMSYDDVVDPRDRYTQDRGKTVVEGEAFGPLPYDRRGKIPAISIDRKLIPASGDKSTFTPIARLSGSLVGIVKQDWRSSALSFRRHRLDRERFEALIIALLGGAEKSQGDYRVSLRAPGQDVRTFSMPEPALRELVSRCLGEKPGSVAELPGYELKVEVLRASQSGGKELSAWPLRGLRLEEIAGQDSLVLSSARDINRVERHLATQSAWTEDSTSYRVVTYPLLTRWDRDQAR